MAFYTIFKNNFAQCIVIVSGILFFESLSAIFFPAANYLKLNPTIHAYIIGCYGASFIVAMTKSYYDYAQK